MMKKIILALIILVSSACTLNAQQYITFGGGAGFYPYSSENSLHLLKEKKARIFFLFNTGYRNDTLYGYKLSAEYNFLYTSRERILEFVKTAESSPDPIAYYGIDYYLINHCLDLNIFWELGSNFSFGIGPTLVLTNRIVEQKDLAFYDRLTSLAAGLNGILEIKLPMDNDEKLYFLINCRLRYTHSIYFDEGIRKLDDYSQGFLTSQLSLGFAHKI